MSILIAFRKAHDKILPLTASGLIGHDISGQELAALPSAIEGIRVAKVITVQISLLITGVLV